MTVPPHEEKLAEPVLTERLARLEGWTREGDAITKTYQCRGWKRALALVAAIGEAAIALDHHPDIHLERYRYVRVVLTTHVVHGLSQADLDLAARIDALAAG
jgi:4a-hydroxytetrahydrobiopterin dehydratase